MGNDENRKRIIDAALWEIAHKSNPTAVEITERVKRKYWI